jgi:hypothetical protein
MQEPVLEQATQIRYKEQKISKRAQRDGGGGICTRMSATSPVPKTGASASFATPPSRCVRSHTKKQVSSNRGRQVADRTRTGNGVVNSHLLCHLSYRHRLPRLLLAHAQKEKTRGDFLDGKYPRVLVAGPPNGRVQTECRRINVFSSARNRSAHAATRRESRKGNTASSLVLHWALSMVLEGASLGKWSASLYRIVQRFIGKSRFLRHRTVVGHLHHQFAKGTMMDVTCQACKKKQSKGGTTFYQCSKCNKVTCAFCTSSGSTYCKDSKNGTAGCSGPLRTLPPVH